MSADRFVVKSNADLIAGGWAGLDEDGFSVFDSLKNVVVGSDGGEPEDQLLIRDWRWVAEALNAVDRQRTDAERAMRQMAERDSDGNEFAHVVTLKEKLERAEGQFRAVDLELNALKAKYSQALIELEDLRAAKCFWCGIKQPRPEEKTH